MPQPQPGSLAHQDQLAERQCIDIARTTYPGIDWRYLVGVSSEPYTRLGVDGTRVVMEGSRGDQGFRVACFMAPEEEPWYALFRLHPITGEPTEVKL